MDQTHRLAFWRCCCGEVNVTVVGEVARCVACRTIALCPELIDKPVL